MPGCLFSRNIILWFPANRAKKRLWDDSLIIYVRIQVIPIIPKLGGLKEKKKDSHFIIGSRFSGSRTWARLSWVHLLLHMAATEITQWNSVGRKTVPGGPDGFLPGLAPSGTGWKAGHSWPEEVRVTLPAQWSQGCQTFSRAQSCSEGSQSQEV